ncbi:hypothetical protein SAMN06272735_0048 [Streptomyces sp. TLI_55]|nr:hypothetical protein SAMN06272735_0048 [Streptomyces sp. TLI_55]
MVTLATQVTVSKVKERLGMVKRRHASRQLPLAEPPGLDHAVKFRSPRTGPGTEPGYRR